MHAFVKNSADKWVLFLDYQGWVDKIENDTGGIVVIQSIDWTLDTTLTKETETPANVVSNKGYLVGSGGVAGATYDNTVKITYALSTVSGLTDATKTDEFSVTMEAG